jgi:hypothetical protein
MSAMLTKSNVRSSDHLPSADPMDYEVRHQPMTQQLLVTSSADRLPEGVVTALDLIAAGGR